MKKGSKEWYDDSAKKLNQFIIESRAFRGKGFFELTLIDFFSLAMKRISHSISELRKTYSKVKN